MNSLNGLYSLSAVSDAVGKLESMGYSSDPMESKTPLLDSFVMHSPDDKHYNYIFDAVPLNEWSSAYRVYRCRKVPKTVWNRIQAYYDSIPDGENTI